mgnify:CR=1 FL=1
MRACPKAPNLWIQGRGIVGNGARDDLAARDMREVAHPAQQAPGDARRSARPAGDLGEPPVRLCDDRPLRLLRHAGVTADFSYVSMAGGAFLEWLEGKALPGIEALKH